MNKEILFEDLGTKAYKEVWDYQETLLQETVRIKQLNNEAPATTNYKPQTTNYLLFVEHPPVYTLGKNGNADNVLIADGERRDKGIEYFHINRGGDITFHGPGQIVGYPVFDLDNFKTDLGWYLRSGHPLQPLGHHAWLCLECKHRLELF